MATLLLLLSILAGGLLCRAQVVTQDERVLLNTPASLKCSLQTSQEVLIVTWQKIKPTIPENMITFSKDHGVVVQPAYKDKINITQLGLQNSTITFWNTTLEDEGCYNCLFNTFGSGKISGVACLTLSAQPTTQGENTAAANHTETGSRGLPLPLLISIVSLVFSLVSLVTLMVLLLTLYFWKRRGGDYSSLPYKPHRDC